MIGPEESLKIRAGGHNLPSTLPALVKGGHGYPVSTALYDKLRLYILFLTTSLLSPPIHLFLSELEYFSFVDWNSILLLYLELYTFSVIHWNFFTFPNLINRIFLRKKAPNMSKPSNCDFKFC